MFADSRATTRTPPCSVNLMAFPIRFVNSCRNRTGSVVTYSGSPSGASYVSEIDFLLGLSAQHGHSLVNQLERGAADLLDVQSSGFDL